MDEADYSPERVILLIRRNRARLAEIENSEFDFEEAALLRKSLVRWRTNLEKDLAVMELALSAPDCPQDARDFYASMKLLLDEFDSDNMAS